MREYVLTTYKDYIENQYNEKLKNHLEKYIDFDELHFIESEINFFTDCYNLTNDFNYEKELCTNKQLLDIISLEIREFAWDDYDLEKCEKLTYTYKKILSFLNDKKEQLTNEPQQLNYQQIETLNWQGSQTEFIELIKALIENGNIEGKQSEIIRKLSYFFNINIKYENKLINDLKTRNNGSETLFLDKLKKSLLNFITLEKKK